MIVEQKENENKSSCSHWHTRNELEVPRTLFESTVKEFVSKMVLGIFFATEEHPVFECSWIHCDFRLERFKEGDSDFLYRISFSSNKFHWMEEVAGSAVVNHPDKINNQLLIFAYEILRYTLKSTYSVNHGMEMQV